MNKKPLGYLAGNIMSFGDGLARQYEYDKIKELNLPVDVYSPIMNKSINDKSNMTEEENNHLAEKIVEADVDRLWNSDFVVMCPEQSAIGSMCETGILYGWKYMCDRLKSIMQNEQGDEQDMLEHLIDEIDRIANKKNYYHYFDIRTNHLNEKDWRRSFSINQFLYGCILLSAKNGDFQTFEEIMNCLKKEYGTENEKDEIIGGEAHNDL